jgi:chemotaxis protein MotC
VRRPRALATLCAVSAALALLAAGPACAEVGLLPYQMVRSLQLVQDRIAGGDHAALPMQRKLLELTDARFRSASDEEFGDARNFRALLIYAMSGGNPHTVASVLSRLELNDVDRKAGAGIVSYLQGDVGPSRAILGSIEPSDHPEELAAFLYLVKGSVIGAESAPTGIAMLDRARLLGPGTLVEEAALRRTIAFATTQQDAAKFTIASEQYARRFLRSPYSAQFAEAFVAGIISLKSKLDMERIGEAIDWMTPEQAKTVYLRLARRSAIEGDRDLLAFASERASRYSDVVLQEGDPRSELYSSISSVTSDTVDQVLSRLDELDPRALSASDRELLRAAKAVASEVIAPVPAALIKPPSSVPAEPDPEAAIEDDLDPGPIEDRAVEEALPVPETSEPAAAPDATDTFLASSRSKLDAIDKLLEETQE